MNIARVWLTTMLALAACEKRAPEPRFTREPEPTPARTPAEEPASAATPKSAAAVDAGASEDDGGATEQADAALEAAKSVSVDASQSAAAAPAPTFVRNPTSPDPLAGKFTLQDATKGLPAKGTLTARLETGYGPIQCKLFEDKAPNTVANFVGLARGLRPFWDAKSAAWVKRPVFDGTTFHRAVAGFMIQGGDHLGDGTGGVGYEIADELVPGWSHDRAGLLCMANRGPNTNGGQFFITDGAAPHLTQMNTFTIFGECTPLETIHEIASAPRPNPHSERPEPPIPIKRVTISRK